MPVRLPSIAAIMLLAACSQGSEPAPAPTSSTMAETQTAGEVDGPRRTVLAFGDSLFAGYGLAKDEGYPERLEEALRGEGVNARVIDAGVSGDTSAAGAQRLAFVLDGLDDEPDLVLLELGGNDMLRGVQPDQVRANFRTMLDELRGRGIPVLIMGMRAPPNYGTEYQEALDGLYAELAEEYGAGLVPFWLESIYQDHSLFQQDRIHPTADGIDRLVEDTGDDVLAALPPS